MVDRHFVLCFVPSAGFLHNFDLIWEINTYASISSEIADASLLGNVFVMITKSGRFFYNWNDKLTEFKLVGAKNFRNSNGVYAAEVSMKDGVLTIFTISRQSLCQILICLNFDEASQLVSQGKDYQSDQKLQMLVCFSSSLRDIAGNLFEVGSM